jgi:hypothetical protein
MGNAEQGAERWRRGTIVPFSVPWRRDRRGRKIQIAWWWKQAMKSDRWYFIRPDRRNFSDLQFVCSLLYYFSPDTFPSKPPTDDDDPSNPAASPTRRSSFSPYTSGRWWLPLSAGPTNRCLLPPPHHSSEQVRLLPLLLRFHSTESRSGMVSGDAWERGGRGELDGQGRRRSPAADGRGEAGLHAAAVARAGTRSRAGGGRCSSVPRASD